MENNDLAMPQAARAVVPDGIEPLRVSPVPASIPIAFTSDWRGEIAAAANEHGVPPEAINAAAYTWLAKIMRWEAGDLDATLKALARQQQTRMGMAMAMGAALAAAQGAIS